MTDPEQILRVEPSTPEELAAFKAAKSKRYRSRQTTINLVLAMAATVGAMMALVFMVVRPEGNIVPKVDYPAVAEQAAADLDFAIAVPKLFTGWSANAAELRSDPSDRLSYWYVGYLTAGEGFIGSQQRQDADPTWITRVLGGAFPTGAEQIGGIEWQVFDRREVELENANLEYALATVLGETTVILYGTAGSDEFRALAAEFVTAME